ncbi:PorV/PorQ family protein [Rubrivirga sp. S365]|uniref:PorV/PorQ family protein n=1 Tax=Rubrivirga sp. S365 TaxID=3076080 RepID=UPI0028C95440|nr:PorV/PorQ family protein [Rubrivirga sp. S365]MDT7855886.1 PorV/PorQ family protein [Rubrivirga sp. S365]
MRPFRLLACAALAVALAAPPSAAQSRRETGFGVARLDASTRAAALAGAGALPGDDPTALFYNPSLLSSEMDGAVALSYANLVLDVGSGAAVYARDVRGVSGAVGVRFVSYGEFDRATGGEVDGDEGTFGASEAAVTVSAAREVLPAFRVGATVHALFSSVDDADARALAADVGVSLAVPGQALTLGASLHHAGVVLSSLGESRDRLPLDLRLTAVKRLQYVPLTVSLALTDLQAFEGPAPGDSSFVGRALDHVALGGELALGSTLKARVGYNGRRAGDLDAGGRLDLAGLSLGAGLTLRRVTVDYAYVGWSRFCGLHQFGVRTRL